MKAISFAWTTGALEAGRKTCTRRQWVDSYARTFHAGDKVIALDKDRRAGGREIGIIELTADPVKSDGFPPDDWENEGFAWLEENQRFMLMKGMKVSPAALWQDWMIALPSFWVIRFKVLELRS